MMKIALSWKSNWMDGTIEIAMSHLHLFAKAYQNVIQEYDNINQVIKHDYFNVFDCFDHDILFTFSESEREDNLKQSSKRSKIQNNQHPIIKALSMSK